MIKNIKGTIDSKKIKKSKRFRLEKDPTKKNVSKKKITEKVLKELKVSLKLFNKQIGIRKADKVINKSEIPSNPIEKLREKLLLRNH